MRGKISWKYGNNEENRADNKAHFLAPASFPSLICVPASSTLIRQAAPQSIIRPCAEEEMEIFEIMA